MNTVSNKPDRKGEETSDSKAIRKKAPLTERIMKKAGAAALTVGIVLSSASCHLICPFDTSQLRSSDGDVSDSDTDAGPDTDVLDSDIRDSDTPEVVVDSDVSDGDTVVSDGDVVDSDIVDSDVSDGDIADTDVLDSDISDSDIVDADEEVDSGPSTCPGVSNDSIASENIDLGDSAEVGGYSLTYTGQVAGSDDIYIDVHCAATGDEVETNVVVPLYGTATAHAPLDGKEIEITNHSSSDTGARISATVSDS